MGPLADFRVQSNGFASEGDGSEEEGADALDARSHSSDTQIVAQLCPVAAQQTDDMNTSHVSLF